MFERIFYVFFQISQMKNAAPITTVKMSSVLGLLRSASDPATALTKVMAMPTANTIPEVFRPMI
ncbi:hypothetical protein D3C77_820910 [compost metagenome]